jgi:hypothetical protein
MKPVQTNRFRFGFLGQKPVQTGLTQFFWFDSILGWFGSVFSSLDLVRFDFFDFRLIKPKPNWSIFLKF